MQKYKINSRNFTVKIQQSERKYSTCNRTHPNRVYYKNIIEGAYNRKEKYVPKNKTRKNPKKMYQ
jgi:hypothetical protein